MPKIKYAIARQIIVEGGKRNVMPILQVSDALKYSDQKQSFDLEATEGLEDKTNELGGKRAQLNKQFQGELSSGARAILIAVFMDVYAELFQLKLQSVLEEKSDTIKTNSQYVAKYNDGGFSDYYNINTDVIGQIMSEYMRKQSLLYVAQMVSNTNLRIQGAVMQTIYKAQPTNKTGVFREFNQLAMSTVKSSIEQVKEYMNSKVQLMNKQQETQRLAAEARINMAVTSILVASSFLVLPATVLVLVMPFSYSVVNFTLKSLRHYSSDDVDVKKLTDFKTSNLKRVSSSVAQSNPAPQTSQVTQNQAGVTADSVIKRAVEVQKIATMAQSNNSAVTTDSVIQQAVAVQQIATMAQSNNSAVTTASVTQLVQAVQQIATMAQSNKAAVTDNLETKLVQVEQQIAAMAQSNKAAVTDNLETKLVQVEQQIVTMAQSNKAAVTANLATQLVQVAQAHQMESKLLKDITYKEMIVDVDKQSVFNNEAQVMLERKLEVIAMQQQLIATAMDKKNQIIQAILAQLFGAAFERNSVLQSVVSQIQSTNEMAIEAFFSATQDWLIRHNAIQNIDSELKAAAMSAGLTVFISTPLSIISNSGSNKRGWIKSSASAGSDFTKKSTLTDDLFLELMFKRGHHKAVTENFGILVGVGSFDSSKKEFKDKAKKSQEKLGVDIRDRERNRAKSMESSQVMGLAALNEYSKLKGEDYKRNNASESSKNALYETIAGTSQGFSGLIKKRYGDDSLKPLKNSIQERAQKYQQLVDDLRLGTADELGISHDGKIELNKIGAIDSSNLLKIMKDRGVISFIISIIGSYRDKVQNTGLYSKANELWMRHESGHTQVSGLSDADKLLLINKLKELDNARLLLLQQAVGKGLVSATLYYASLGIIPSGVIDGSYDKYKKEKKVAEIEAEYNLFLGENSGKNSEIPLQDLIRMRQKAGKYWKSVLFEFSQRNVQANNLYNRYKPAYSPEFFVAQVQNKYRDHGGDDFQFEWFVDEGAEPAGVLKTLIETDPPLFDKDGISQIPKLIPGTANLLNEIEKKQKILKWLRPILNHNQLKPNQLEWICSSIADVMCDIRECVIDEVTV